MKLNKDKRIGRILFVVEGSQTEFSILKRIFSNILGYTYIEKRRNKLTYFTSEKDRYSQVAIINTKDSNIKDISEVATDFTADAIVTKENIINNYDMVKEIFKIIK